MGSLLTSNLKIKQSRRGNSRTSRLCSMFKKLRGKMATGSRKMQKCMQKVSKMKYK